MTVFQPEREREILGPRRACSTLARQWQPSSNPPSLATHTDSHASLQGHNGWSFIISILSKCARTVNVTLKSGSWERHDTEHELDMFATFSPTMKHSHICSSWTANMTWKACFCSSAVCVTCYRRSQTIHQSIGQRAKSVPFSQAAQAKK